jgi:tripartite-type tricarboxylate transporter receptor subunit TctC
MALVAGCASGGSGSGGGASGKACGDAVGAPAGADLAFFCGKTITYVVDDEAGSENDLLMEAMRPYVEKYLGAKIKPVYYPGTNVTGMNTTTTAKADGLTLGTVSMFSSLQYKWAGQNVLKFNVGNISYVQVNKAYEYILVSCEGSPYTSIAQVLSSTKPVKIVDINTFIMLRALFPAYNIPHTFISGYTGSTQGPGCARGDGDVAASPPSDFTNAAQTALDPGEQTLLITNPIPSNSSVAFMNSAPTLAKFIAEHPATSPQAKTADQLLLALFQDGIQGGVVGPPGIPAARLLALKAAFKYATQQPSVQKAFTNLGVPTQYVDPATAQPYAKKMLAETPLIKEYFSCANDTGSAWVSCVKG